MQLILREKKLLIMYNEVVYKDRYFILFITQIFILIAKRNSRLGPANDNLFLQWGAPRLFPRLLIVLMQLTHFAIECQVLAPDPGICFVII